MNYNPNDKESIRHAMLAAMVEISGYNATIRQLNQSLKSNPGQRDAIANDKGYLKHKFSAKQKDKAEKPINEPIIADPAPAPASALAPVPEINPNNNKKGKKIGTKEQVFYGEAEKTSGGLIKADLILSKAGKVISKKKSEYGQQFAAQRLKDFQARKKANQGAANPEEKKENVEASPELEEDEIPEETPVTPVN